MSAHQCICAEEAPVLCKGNSTEMCLRTVHQECLLFWERTQPASTVHGATPKGTNCLVCPMHHPQYQVKRWKAFQREKYHPSPLKYKKNLSADNLAESINSSKSNDSRQSLNLKSSDSPDLKHPPPMIEGIDLITFENAIQLFERDKYKYISRTNVSGS